MVKLSCFKRLSKGTDCLRENGNPVYVEITLSTINYESGLWFRVNVNRGSLDKEIEVDSYEKALSIYLNLLSVSHVSDDLITENGLCKR